MSNKIQVACPGCSLLCDDILLEINKNKIEHSIDYKLIFYILYLSLYKYLCSLKEKEKEEDVGQKIEKIYYSAKSSGDISWRV